MHTNPYRIRSYTNTNPGETPASFSPQLRLNGKYFHIHVGESRFRNSPVRMPEFHQYLSFLMSEEEELDEEDQANAPPATTHITTTMASPLMTASLGLRSHFLTRSENWPPSRRLRLPSLDVFFNSDSYESRLGATDDRLAPGPIDVIQNEPDFIP